MAFLRIVHCCGVPSPNVSELYSSVSIRILDEEFDPKHEDLEPLPKPLIIDNPFIRICVVGIFHQHFVDFARRQPNWSVSEYLWPARSHVQTDLPMRLWKVYVDGEPVFFLTTLPSYEYVLRIGRQIYQLAYSVRQAKPEVELWYFPDAFRLYPQWSGLQEINVKDKIIIAGNFKALRDLLLYVVPFYLQGKDETIIPAC